MIRTTIKSFSKPVNSIKCVMTINCCMLFPHFYYCSTDNVDYYFWPRVCTYLPNGALNRMLKSNHDGGAIYNMYVHDDMAASQLSD